MRGMTPRILPSDPSSEYWFEEGCFITELLNEPGDPGVSIARVRVPAKGTTRWHRLAGITERYVILAGSGRVEIGELAPQDVQPGDVVVIPPGMRQRIANRSDEDLVFLAICSPRFVREAYEYPDGA
jgi:mannose-6-phosphate isomerase-like protein (cupin superfamily)